MASVFGIDLIRSTTELFRKIRSTTELFRNARLRKKTSPWDGEQTGQSRVVRHMPNDDVGRLVEHEIIPRLLMVHQDDPRMAHFPADSVADMVTPAMHAQDGGDGFRDTSGTQSNDNQRPGAGSRGFASMAPLFDEAAIRAFADEVLAHEVNTLADIIIGHLDREVAPETLFIQLIAPTARELGEKWNRDECDFVDVTMGLWRLQLLLRTIAVWAPPPDGWALRTHRALFTTMPRDQHSLGTLMIGECFQRAGWDVETLIEPEQSEILLALGSSSFDVVGLTVTTDFYIAQVPKLLTAMRSVSCNPKLAIMIGGPAIGYDPELARKLGADGTAADAAAALALADELVSAGVERTALSL